MQGRKGKRPLAGNPVLSHPCGVYAPGEILLFEVEEARNFIKIHIPALKTYGKYRLCIPLLPTDRHALEHPF